jgi:hypothetical protein
MNGEIHCYFRSKDVRIQGPTLTPVARRAADTEVVRKLWAGHAVVDIRVLFGAVREIENPMKFFLATYFGSFFLQN